MNLSKLGILLYGSLIYVIFLLTFLYCIGFVAGFAVPTTLDEMGREPATFAQALTVNVSLLGLFAVQHMIMARRWFKKRWTRIIHPAMERSTFVLVTCAILIAMFLRWEAMPTIVWEIQNQTLRIVVYSLAGLGWAGVLVSTFLIDHFELFGLKQVIRHFRGVDAKGSPFLVRSFYKYTRHPLYLSFFIAFWCAPTMTVGHLVFALLCTGFVLIAVNLEERDLVAEHGDNYRQYRRDVPKLLPSLSAGGRHSTTVPSALPSAR